MILFIDDDERGMRPFRQALELCGYSVRWAADPDSAIAAVEELGNNIRLVILDMLMPTGEALSPAETEAGLTTGTALYPLLRGAGYEGPVVVLSITSTELRQGKDVDAILRKRDTSPPDLCDFVNDLLGPPPPEELR